MGILDATELDPEGAELKALLGAVDFADACVLEVGTGGGRLAYQYAGISGSVVGVEPEVERLTSAVEACSNGPRRRPRFVRSDAEALPFRDGAFDIVLLAWSL